ncbi:hypothetical protein [Spirillospora sp. CA-294931]|uniref:hypothetical protein n=1 Tax=Spirillospora sp. CA-294931 TaxID=3240042 RepID=UPI003D8A64FB
MALAFRQKSFDGAVAEFAFARACVPFFQAMPDPGDWTRIPLTKRSDYRVNFPARVLARGRALHGPGTLTVQSTGEGDDRVTTAVGSGALADRMRTTLEAHPALRAAVMDGAEPRRSARYTAPACTRVECASPYTPVHDRVLADGTLVLPTTPDPLAAPDPLLVRAAGELAGHAPRWLLADPAHLAHLVRGVGAGRPAPKLDAIVLTHTPATRLAQRQIRERHPEALVAEAVSMSEFGWLAVECPRGLTHLNNVSYFVELITETGQPAHPGELAELVVTSIGDRLSPHIRYRTGDLYRVWDEPCGCGSDLPPCRLEGRAGTLLTVPGRVAPVGPREVDRAVGDVPEIDAYQLRQYREDAFRIAFVPNVKDTGRVEKGLVERLRFLLGGRVGLDAAAVGYLPAARSGRLHPCASDLPPRTPAASRKEATC